MKQVFIVNPLSETVAKKGSVLKSIAQADTTTIPQSDISYFEVDFSGSIDTTIAQAANGGAEHIFIEGGDGTTQGILTAFFRHKSKFKTFPKFTLLRGGMTNQVSKTIGLKNRQPSKIQNTMQFIGTKTHHIPMLKIRSDGHPDYFGFLFSTGAVPMITDYTKREVHKKGIGGSSAVAAGILKGVSGRADDVMSKTALTLNISGPTQCSISENHLGTLVTTLPSLIMGLDPFWGTEDAPLRLTVAGEHTRKLYKHVPAIWLGRKHVSREMDGLQSYNADCLSYSYNGPIVLDGEPVDFNGQDFEISATEPIQFVY